MNDDNISKDADHIMIYICIYVYDSYSHTLLLVFVRIMMIKIYNSY